MEVQFTSEDSKRIRRGIREKYRKVAINPDGLFSYPTGRAGLEVLGYDPIVLNSLPDEISASYCGVGNPFSLGEINEGEVVMDIGCGAGVDVIFASKIVGASGKVVGVELVSDMLDRGRNNIQMMDLQNVTLIEDSAEKISFPDESFDVVISNGAFNLIPNKESAIAEAFRLLKPGGRFMIADQVFIGGLEKDLRARIDTWFQWEGGTIPGMDFLALLKKAGFEKAELVGETGFNSSPKTKGVLFRAEKPTTPVHKQEPTDDTKHGDEKVHNTLEKRTRPSIEKVVEKAYALGCEKAKIIDTSTVIIEKWVRWKCLYGCPFYNKDGYHPPFAPGVDETKEVLGEYTKAILLNGPKGKELTNVAVRLEGEAYQMGFYKAFALTALPSGSGGESNSGATWPSGEDEGPCDLQKPDESKNRIRPMMEACGIDVFRTARNNGFEIDTRKETYGRWNYFALVLIE